MVRKSKIMFVDPMRRKDEVKELLFNRPKGYGAHYHQIKGRVLKVVYAKALSPLLPQNIVNPKTILERKYKIPHGYEVSRVFGIESLNWKDRGIRVMLRKVS